MKQINKKKLKTQRKIPRKKHQIKEKRGEIFLKKKQQQKNKKAESCVPA